LPARVKGITQFGESLIMDGSENICISTWGIFFIRIFRVPGIAKILFAPIISAKKNIIVTQRIWREKSIIKNNYYMSSRK